VFGNAISPLPELGFHRRIILLQKPIDRGNQAHNFLFCYFHSATNRIRVW